MIRFDIDAAVAVVTLDRPPVNALDEAMVDGLADALDRIEAHPGVAAVVFRGAHSRFCAGADISMVAGFLDDEGGVDRMVAFVARLQEVYARVENLGAVTVAALEGVAVGGGLELALACDLRVAGQSARLGLPEAALGLLPGGVGTQRLARIAGRGTALRTILTAESYSGAEAHGLHFVQWAVPDDRVQEETMALAQRAAGLSRPALAAAKRCIALAPSREGYQAELEGMRELLDDPESRCRITSFLSKSSTTRGNAATP